MPSFVNCPTCGVSNEYSATNPWRPFCCQRCKLIDLGAWAAETYRIAGKSTSEKSSFQVDLDSSQQPN